MAPLSKYALKLIFLHGPPASGKFTIAKEIEKLISCKNFHNHLTIDVAKALFEFGTPRFKKLVQTIRLVALETAVKENLSTVLFTFVYSHPHSIETVQQIESVIVKHGGEFIPVYLQCQLSELEKRIVQPHRVEMRKVSSVEGLAKFNARWNCVPMPREDCLIIQTDNKTPEECAFEIVSELDLV